MRLLLIRHGETVDNVAGIYAGTTDSALTTHGVLQASRLGSHLAASGVNVCYLFSSDLQRAFKTAEAIRLSQPDGPECVTQLQNLREQDFGFYEGKHFHERPKGSTKSGREAHRETHLNAERFPEIESKQSMITRVEAFLDDHLMPLLPYVADDETVAVVAHGIILTHLWRSILGRFLPGNVSVAAGVMVGGAGLGLEYLGGWSNTGYLELEITSKGGVLPRLDPAHPKSVGLYEQDVGSGSSAPAQSSNPMPDKVSSLPTQQSATALPPMHKAEAPVLTMLDESIPILKGSVVEFSRHTSLPLKLPDLALVVKAVNSQEHLSGLKKTRGGIGSLKHDEKQKTMDSFFK